MTQMVMTSSVDLIVFIMFANSACYTWLTVAQQPEGRLHRVAGVAAVDRGRY